MRELLMVRVEERATMLRRGCGLNIPLDFLEQVSNLRGNNV